MIPFLTSERALLLRDINHAIESNRNKLKPDCSKCASKHCVQYEINETKRAYIAYMLHNTNSKREFSLHDFVKECAQNVPLGYVATPHVFLKETDTHFLAEVIVYPAEGWFLKLIDQRKELEELYNKALMWWRDKGYYPQTLDIRDGKVVEILGHYTTQTRMPQDWEEDAQIDTGVTEEEWMEQLKQF